MPELPPPDPPEPGSEPTSSPDAALLFARYRVERELGRGGMGRVLLAFDTKLRIHVAIKLVPEQLMADAEAADDLRREVLRGMALTHSAIVRTHTFEQDDTGAAIVMEYIDGLTLSDWKKQQPGQCFDADQLLPWLGPLCEALDYAHREARIVHRDLKPRNIMISQEGRLKVADFGIAASLSDSVSRVTGAGPSSGTPAYMSPQQARGKMPSPLDDVYALGATIYELLASKPPFFRGNVDTILHQLAFETPPTIAERREELEIEGKAPIPDVWERTIAACLAKEPAERPQSCGEVLTRLLAPESAPAAEPPPGSGGLQPPTPPAAPQAPISAEECGGLSPALVDRRLQIAAPSAAPARPQRPIVRVATPGEWVTGSLVPPRPRRGQWIALVAAALVLGAGAWWFASGKKPVAASSESPVKSASVASAGSTETVPAAATPAPATPLPATPTPSPSTPKPALASATPTATPKPPGEIEKWLAQVDGIYQPKYQQEVIAPYESGMAALQQNTLATLDREIASASRAARLNDSLAFRNERQRIEAGLGVPADDSDMPPAVLMTLREIYRKQSAQLEADRRKQLTTVFGQYDQALATNQSALTQRQRLDEALLLQQRRDALKKAWFAPPPKRGTPTAATKERPFVNSLGMKFVPVPGTDVLFCIHETRRQDYAKYASEVPGVESAWKNLQADGIPMADKEDHPVAGVSWEDANAFCAWLGKKEERTYRLPTDKEWSYAVGVANYEDWANDATPEKLGGKVPDRFPWGGSYPPKSNDRSGNYADTAFKEKFPGKSQIAGYTDGFATTAPVMSFKPNELGIYDLGGNVWEWCEDWYGDELMGRTLRGSCWQNSDPGNLRSARRGFPKHPAFPPFTRGFRSVLETRSAGSTRVSATAPTPASGSAAPPATVVPPPAAATIPSPTPRPPLGVPTRADDALAKATKDAPFTNSLGMKFVPVPGIKVLFCVHETRRQDYAAYAAEVPGVDGAWKNQQRDGTPCGDKDDHPAVGVNWEDAQKFGKWLSKKEGKTYRLPTDEEWSIAVGLGQKDKHGKGITPEMLDGKETTEFPWGGDYPPKTKDVAGNYGDMTWYEKFPAQASMEGYTDGFPTTAPVMSFKPNKAGLYDMGGNVWEWVEDWWNDAQKDRVLRGASFTDCDRGYLLSSDRVHRAPGNRGYYGGFRCVVELSGP